MAAFSTVSAKRVPVGQVIKCCLGNALPRLGELRLGAQAHHSGRQLKLLPVIYRHTAWYCRYQANGIWNQSYQIGR